MERANRKHTLSARKRNDQSGSSPYAWMPAAVPAPEFVQSPPEYARMLSYLEGQPWLALDTESDSLYRYVPRVCLLQISAPALVGTPRSEGNAVPVHDFLIDPLQLHDLSALGHILANDETEVVLHAADNDIPILQREFDFRIRRLFDTQLAARILGRKRVGLAQILKEEFGVVSDKRMQRTNWGQRPLTPQQMIYAQMDTHYLPALRARQFDQLQQAGRWEEAQDAFRICEMIEYSPPQPRTFWQMKQVHTVAAEDLGVLQALWRWREQVARRSDRPPFKILGENTLLLLAQKCPTTMAGLRGIPGLPPRQIDRLGKGLLAAIRQGRQQPIPQPPTTTWRSKPALSAQEREQYDTLRRWRMETASARQVDPDIVFRNDTLRQIITCQPTSLAALQAIPGVGQWKSKTYGPALLKLLHSSGL